MRISDWSSDVFSSDLVRHPLPPQYPSRPKGLNVLGTLAHNPELATAYHTLTGYILFGSNLSARQRELLVLRVAAVRGSRYEWLQHTILAADAGITPEEVRDRKRVVAGKGVSERVDLGGRRLIKKKKKIKNTR